MESYYTGDVDPDYITSQLDDVTDDVTATPDVFIDLVSSYTKINKFSPKDFDQVRYH